MTTSDDDLNIQPADDHDLVMRDYDRSVDVPIPFVPVNVEADVDRALLPSTLLILRGALAQLDATKIALAHAIAALEAHR